MPEVRASLLALLVLAAGPAHAAEPPSRHEVRARVEEVLSDPRFQRTRPDGSLDVPPTPPPENFELPDFGPKSFEPSAASGVSEALLWVLLAIIAAAVLGVLAREGVRFSRKRKARKRKKAKGGEGGALDLAQLAAERLPASLAMARRLAGEGRFEEAIHVLLEGALGYLHALADFSLEPSYTSREVLMRAPLESDTRGAFGDLVMTVEVSLFGGLPVDASDFSRCETSFVTMHRQLGGADG